MRWNVLSSFLIVILIGFAAVSYAQQNKTFSMNGAGNTVYQPGLNPSKTLKSMSLLDPERFTMKHQTVMSYSSSSMYGSSGLNGLYLNTMTYRFKMPLTMRLRVAYQNNMSGLLSNSASSSGRNNLQTGNLYIPSFDLVYQPWKNTTISFHYRDFSGSNMYNGYGYSRFGRYSRFRPY